MEGDAPSAPRVTLRAEDHFACRWSAMTRSHVWAVKHRPVAWTATFFNLYALSTAVRMIESFQPLHVEDYAISELGGPLCTPAAAAASPPAPAASGLTSLLRKVGATTSTVNTLQLDMAAQMERCHASLNQLGEKEELRAARSLYWYLFYACALVALLVDLLRLCGLSTTVGDALLGFRSAAGEARRFRPLLLALVPMCHLGFFYTRAFRVPCCVATPKLDVALDRMRTLLFLLFISCYCLLADAHNHGYFLLRIPDGQRSALRLLREVLGAPPPRAGDDNRAAQEMQGLREGSEQAV
jgi:hypothetical protein